MDIVSLLKSSAMRFGYTIDFVFPIAMSKTFQPSAGLLFPTNPSAVPTKNSIHEQLPFLYQRKIKLLAGTHVENHRHEELPRPFPVLTIQLIEE